MDVADEQPELLPLVDLVGRAGAVVGEVDVHGVDAHGLVAAEVVKAAIAGNPVKPRSDLDRPLVGENGVECRRHDLLEDVLGVLSRSEQVPAERQQSRLVATDEGLERRHVSSPDERDQPLVGLKAQDGRARVQPKSPAIFES